MRFGVRRIRCLIFASLKDVFNLLIEQLANFERQRKADLLNFGMDEPDSVIGPQGWLFHDLTEHGYGAHQTQVAPAEWLRVGEVQVDG
jgi:hypothetical protein